MTMQEKLEKEINTTNWFIDDKEDLLDYYISKLRTSLANDDNHDIAKWVMSYARDIDNTYKEIENLRILMIHLKGLQKCQEDE